MYGTFSSLRLRNCDFMFYIYIEQKTYIIMSPVWIKSWFIYLILIEYIYICK